MLLVEDASMRVMTAMIVAFVAVMLCARTPSLAADPHAPTMAPAHGVSAAGAAAPAHDGPAPAPHQSVLPPGGIRWPAVMMIIVLGMFLAAIVVGPVVRMTLPEEEPVAHGHDAHDDDHGQSHGRGHVRPRTPLDDPGHGGHH